MESQTKALQGFLTSVRENPKDAFSNLGNPDFDSAVEVALRNRYVKGIVAKRVVSGRLTIEILSDDEFSLTPAGENYLSGKSL